MMSPLQVKPVTLEYKHTRLEPVSMAHYDTLLEQAWEPEIWQYMGNGNLGDPERLRVAIDFSVEESAVCKGLTFSIISLADNKAVGMTSLYDIQPHHRSLELGRTWIGKDYRRTPINTEAKYLLLSHCFETLGANRVTIKTDARNIRSQRAIERIGGVREGVLRYHMVLWDGYVRDTVYYGVIAPEWPQTKARLESLMQQYAPTEQS